MSLYEDQVYKWENCLDPSEDIKYHDRTFKLIKNKLLKMSVNRGSSMLNPDDNNSLQDNPN